jgi:hypothetical protein
MEEQFRDWWYLTSCDGIIPCRYFEKLLHSCYVAYNKSNFQFIYREKELFERLTSYFYLLYKIHYLGLKKKRIEGPSVSMKLPQGWTIEDENEWIAQYWYVFDSVFWENTFGQEKPWENDIYKWRYELPSILSAYTKRGRDVLPFSHDDDDEAAGHEHNDHD